MDDFSSFIIHLLFCFFAIVAENCGIGVMNEDLEIIKPKMRKVKLPEKLKDYIPQWAPRSLVPSRDVESKSEVYILTVILTICNYIYHTLCFIATIIVYILAPSYLKWSFLPIGCSAAVMAGINFVVEFQSNRILRKNPLRMDRDFTIENKDNNDKKEDKNDK